MNKETGEAEKILLDDVLFILVTGKDLTIHTHHGVYRPVQTLEDFTEHLKVRGFEQLDRSNLVNMARVTRFDPYSKIAFFEYDDLPTKACNVSRRNLSKIKHLPN